MIRHAPVHHVAVWAGLLLSVFASAQSSDFETVDKLNTILHSVHSTRKLSKADLKFALKESEGTCTSCALQALLVLTEASKDGLYPKKDLLRRLENKIIASDRAYVSLYSSDYESALPVRGSGEHPYKKQFNDFLYSKKSQGTLSADEKALVLKLLADAFPANQRLAGRLFMTHRGLNADAYQWIKSKTDIQIRKEKGNDKQFWLLVQRVAKTKNHG